MPYRQNTRTGQWVEVDAQGAPLNQRPSGVFALPPSPQQQQSMQNANQTQGRDERARADAHAKTLLDLREKGFTMSPDGSIVPLPASTTAPTPAMIAHAQQLIDGRMILSAREKGQPEGRALIDLANSMDPTFDEAASKARWTARQQFTGEGKGSLAVQGAERFATHLNAAYGASQDLGGADLGFSPLSNLATAGENLFKQDKLAAYHGFLVPIAGELQKLVKNGAASQMESDHIMADLNPSNPPSVRNAALRTLTEVGQAQLDPTRQAWASAWAGSKAPPMPMDFTPGTQAVFDNITAGKPKALPVDSHGGPIAPASLGGGTGGGAPPPGARPSSGGGTGPGGGTVWGQDITGPAAPGGIASGTAADTKQSLPIPPAMQREYEAYVSAHRGALDPADYTAFRNHLDEKYLFGVNPGSADTYAAEAQRMNAGVKAGGQLNLQIPAAEKQGKLSYFGQMASTPEGALAAHFTNEATGGIPAMMAGDPGRGALAAMNTANHKMSMAGDVGGFMAGSYGLGRLGKAVGFLKDAAPVASEIMAPQASKAARIGGFLKNTSPDMLLGASNGASENPDHPLAGAIEGGGAALAGGAFGHTVIAPGLRAAVRTGPGAAVAKFGSNLVAGARDTTGGLFDKFTGGFSQAAKGEGPGFTRTPALPAGDRMVANSGALTGDGLSNVTGQLQDAQRLNMPMMAADTDPRLAALAGSATRYSPDVGAKAMQDFTDRAAGRNSRAVQLINDNLAPTGNINDIVAGSRKAAQKAADPLYAEAMAQPHVDDPRITALLNTKHGAQAAKLGYANAEVTPGMDMGSINMSLHPVTGEPVYDGALSPQTMQQIKFGMDANVESARDSTTQKLNLTRGTPAYSAQQLRNAYRSVFEDVNKPYAQANQVYGSIARQGSTARQGYDLAGKMGAMDPADVASIAGAVPEQYGDAFRQGVASKFAIKATNLNPATNPHNFISGGDGNAQRLRTLFPDGADNMIQAGQMENQFGQTRTAVTGGSQTQPRSVVDKAFQTGAMPLGLGLDALTLVHGGMPGTGTMLAAGVMRGSKYLADRAEGKLTADAANQVGALTLNQNPAESLAAINDLLKRSAARNAYVSQMGQAGGAIGSRVAAPLLLSAYGSN
jgi:hypothetical protein